MKDTGSFRGLVVCQRAVVILSVLGLLGGGTLSLAEPMPAVSVQKNKDGVTLHLQDGIMQLQVFSPRIIRVVYSPSNAAPAAASLAVIAKPQAVKWKLKESGAEINLDAGELRATVNRRSGAVSFADPQGRPILAEAPGGGRAMAPSQIAGLRTYRATQSFALQPGEAIYGLGQHANGVLNFRGQRIHMQQQNGDVAVPVLISNRGYGVLWDNPAITDVDSTAGDTVTWTSEPADAIDYYVMYGPGIDDAIAAYRQLTGAAPMFGKWAWGYWQCRERYKTQDELLGILSEFRRRQIPLDVIVQDWFYWDPLPWGSHQFDPKRYPDPTGMIRRVHEQNAHFMISVWARFAAESDNFRELAEKKLLYPVQNSGWMQNAAYYDAFNPDARRIYWRQMNDRLFVQGVDAWWLDSSEPELSGKWGEFADMATAAGPGARVFNAYPLMHTTGIYEGQRQTNSDKRVFILTRSAYSGQQRNAVVTWSGDIKSDWDTFRKQVPAGLGFSISGIPYWNTDIGGFLSRPNTDPDYRECFTRWFQFGAFCPLFRVHGTGAEKEPWCFGPQIEPILIKYDQLRYRLLPYIYSTAWKVTSEGYTMMRPLVMDFASDTKALDIPDQYLFGPAIMVCPVTTPIGNAQGFSRKVYLPTGPWVDFWTGQTIAGGQTIAAPAPLDTLPLFVRAGSIIPMGPPVQYAAEKPADPIELRIYRGADGAFTLYEDENDNYNYEKRIYATISFKWDDSRLKLTIGARRGKFPGMLKRRTFRVVWVGPKAGVGVSESVDAREIVYSGSTLVVSAPGK